MVDTFGTNTVPDSAIMKAVEKVFDLTPRGIITALDLRKPIFQETAAYGHFGRTPRSGKVGKIPVTYFSWERTDKVKELRKAAGAK
jgi:S-adenosylmethionine synthetase